MGQASCKTCPSGYWCGLGAIKPVSCGLGAYCLNATQSATQYLCPIGTFGGSTNLKSKLECTPCTPSHYCSTKGLANTTSGYCKEGYFCGGGSTTNMPNQNHISPLVYSLGAIVGTGEVCLSALNGTINDICPQAHYCIKGSSSPTPCAQGTFSSRVGLNSSTQCEPCSKSFYCPKQATITPLLKCREGYFCPPGTVDPENDPLLTCGKGHMCPLGMGLTS